MLYCILFSGVSERKELETLAICSDSNSLPPRTAVICLASQFPAKKHELLIYGQVSGCNKDSCTRAL